jgi:GrpB-like predicted nucleotidyltransferase (UPF0157 family)
VCPDGSGGPASSLYAHPVSTDPVDLSSYRSDWPERFAAAAGELRPVLGAGFVVEHIGSTAVPGLSAKDCIDILVVAPSLAAFHGATSLVEQVGFEYRPGAFPDHPPHRFFRRVVGGRRTHHLHLLVDGSDEVHAYLALRSLLRSDARARQDYEDVKQRLVSEGADDRGAYIEGKAPVVEALVERALLRWPAPHGDR